MALEGVRGQRHARDNLYPQERPSTHCTGGWVGPRVGLDRCGKSRPPPGFDPRSVQPIASHYTYWATWPTWTSRPMAKYFKIKYFLTIGQTICDWNVISERATENWLQPFNVAFNLFILLWHWRRDLPFCGSCTVTTISIIVTACACAVFFFQIVDQYLPDCHVFLGGVFIEVSWHSWVRHMLTSCPLQVASRTHTCLLHLLIKLANEPNVRQVNVKDMYMLPLQCYGTGSLHMLGFWSVCLSPEFWLNLV